PVALRHCHGCARTRIPGDIMNFVKRAASVLTLGLTLSCIATYGGAQTPELKGKFMKTPTG
ncbi:hypothetical protein SCB29_39345, partial [Paraburkholderia sp. SIMBA_055]